MVRILVDSSSDCRKDEFDYFMPIAVNLGGNEYLDGIDITADKFYDFLTSGEEFPKTSQPSPEGFLEIFKKVKEAGDELIYFALSSSLSGTYQGANIAKEMADYEGIYIIDTKAATHMIRILAEYAASLIKKGVSGAKIAEKCEELKGRIHAIAGLDTLEYLYRGGRLSRTSAAVGAIAGIKPVITVSKDGTVESIGKCIGRGKAIQFILDRLSAFDIDEEFPLYTLYTCGEENTNALELKLSEAGFAAKERVQVGSTIGAHIGPGAYGIIFVSK